MRKGKVYGALAIVAVGSSIAVWLCRYDELLQAIAAVPLVGSVVGGLFQVLRDQVAHDRASILQAAQNNFVLGAGSHMAEVAFNKHVEFAEAYMQEALAALVTLYRHGPTPEVLSHAHELRAVREKFLVWLTEALEASLDPFEAAFREIGANAGYIRAMQASQDEGPARQKAIQEMYNRLAQVIGMKEWQGQSISDELAVTSLSRKLREILGTEELTQMRGAILRQAFGADGV